MSATRTWRLSALILLVLSLTATAAALAERDTLPLLDYRTESWFLPQSPGVTGGPVGGLFNPGAWAMTDRMGSDFWWNDRSIRSGLDNYGFGFGRGFNFAMNTTTFGTTGDSYKIYDYQVGVAGGTRAGSFGVGYRWAHGETERHPRQKSLTMGFVSRRTRWTTLGASAAWSLESSAAQYVFDLGIRPFDRNWLTVYADWAVNDDQVFFKGGVWGAGLEVRPVRGLHVGFKARRQPGTGDLDYTGMFGVTLGAFHAAAMPVYNEDGDHLATSGLLRTNPPYQGFPSVWDALVGSDRYYPLRLENKVLTYQKYRYFDDKRIAWLDLLPLLNALRDDSKTDGIALNLTGFRGRPSLIWELRQKLEEFQAAGKKVIIHADRLDPTTYYLASVADHLTLDPWGNLALPGYALSRSYLKGTLEKIGLGFQEFRYFEYKSAMETLSRDSMSEADREQRQRIVDVLYETVREGVAGSRDISPAVFDQAIDENAILSPEEALELGLIDAISRWDQLPVALREQDAGLWPIPPAESYRKFWDDQWGQPKKIPVVYAVGECAMDKGIKGRKTSEYLRKLAADPSVAAVVLRADSPGGDPLPSDLVAGAVRTLKEAGIPVIVSQGDVAASGGYAISMDGSEILTTPLTITGSIGVIGGWVWDDGLTEKVGITSDVVQRGEHADLFSTVNLPFLGGIPRRPLNDTELARIKTMILDSYQKFVAGVALGRDLNTDDVEKIAQGRVWMGGDAVERGLCDGFGSLDDAIQRARRLGNIRDGEEVEILEYPPRPWIQWPSLTPKMPGFFGIGDRFNALLAGLYGLDDEVNEAALGADPFVGAPGLSAYDVEYLKTISEVPGAPVMMISPDVLPADWQELD
ncbi:MAG: S49 family peptidase [Candidatus Krumholzibacteriota bacterium]